MKPRCPCKDCTRREMQCHANCEWYKKFKAELADIATRRESEMEVLDYIVKTVIKRGKKKQ